MSMLIWPLAVAGFSDAGSACAASQVSKSITQGRENINSRLATFKPTSLEHAVSGSAHTTRPHIRQ